MWFQRGCLGQACWGSVQAAYNAHWGTKQGVPFFLTTTSSLYLRFCGEIRSDRNMQKKGENSTSLRIHLIFMRHDNLSCANYRCLAQASWGDGGRGNTPGQLPCQALWRGWMAREGPVKTVRRWRKQRGFEVWVAFGASKCMNSHGLSSAYTLRRVKILCLSQLVMRCTNTWNITSS